MNPEYITFDQLLDNSYFIDCGKDFIFKKTGDDVLVVAEYIKSNKHSDYIGHIFKKVNPLTLVLPVILIEC